MNEFLEILKLAIPSLLVFGVVYFMLKQFLNRELEIKNQQLELQKEEFKQQSRKEFIPLKNQAYERAILYVERIDPNNLVIRLHRAGMSSAQLHSLLLKTIREEYNHNMVQQLYVSKQSWDRLKQAKEETVKILNMAQNQMKENATGIELGAVVFEIVSKLDKIPTTTAVDYMKTEFQKSIR